MRSSRVVVCVGEAVGTDPLPENVGGSIVEKHSWNHEVQHSVQWDYVLMALVALLVAWFLFVRPERPDVPAGEAVEDGEEGAIWE